MNTAAKLHAVWVHSRSWDCGGETVPGDRPTKRRSLLPNAFMVVHIVAPCASRVVTLYKARLDGTIGQLHNEEDANQKKLVDEKHRAEEREAAVAGARNEKEALGEQLKAAREKLSMMQATVQSSAVSTPLIERSTPRVCIPRVLEALRECPAALLPPVPAVS